MVIYCNSGQGLVTRKSQDFGLAIEYLLGHPNRYAIETSFEPEKRGLSSVEDFTLELQQRSETGKGASQRYRNQGLIPSIVYSRGSEGISALVSNKSFRYLAERALTSQVFTLKSEDSRLDGKFAIVKEIQSEPIKGKLLHVDFQMFHEGEPAVVRVPLSVHGEAPGVKEQGGVLTVQCREISVSSPPKLVPSEIEVSVSSLMLGDRIRTGDIELPEGVTLKSNPDETVANVVSGRASRLAEKEEDAAATVAEGGADAPEAAPAEAASKE